MKSAIASKRLGGMFSRKIIQQHMHELRQLIKDPDVDFITKRIAFVVESVLRYEVEAPAGGKKPYRVVIDQAEILKSELKAGVTASVAVERGTSDHE
jgi:hypothetical protein